MFARLDITYASTISHFTTGGTRLRAPKASSLLRHNGGVQVRVRVPNFATGFDRNGGNNGKTHWEEDNENSEIVGTREHVL